MLSRSLLLYGFFLSGFTKQLSPNDKNDSRGAIMFCCMCELMNPQAKTCMWDCIAPLPAFVSFVLFSMEISILGSLSSTHMLQHLDSKCTFLSVLCSHSMQSLVLFSTTWVPSSSHLGFVSASGTGSLNFDSVWAVVSRAGLRSEIWCWKQRQVTAGPLVLAVYTKA